MIVLEIAARLFVLILAAAYVCYRLAFSVPKPSEKAMFSLPDTEQYRPYAETARRMIRAALEIPHAPVNAMSYDGNVLFGKCYRTSPSAPWLLMIHGYRSAAERDFSGGLPVGLENGYNVLLVDQRAHGKSGGRCLTFGVKERFDCKSWVDFIVSEAGADAKIVLYGMSMGAATVLMATGCDLPKNVVGIAADCGYTSPREIIRKVIRDVHCPLFPTYALIRLGGILFGGFDLESASAAEAMERCDLPVLFIHGEDDRFVPCRMGRENFAHCRSAEKRLLTVPNAGHGMSYMADKTAYLHAVSAFLDDVFRRGKGETGEKTQ